MFSGDTRSQTLPTSHETMPSPTQKSTQVSSVIGFSKNSCRLSVVLKSPPANATRISSDPDDRERRPEPQPHEPVEVRPVTLGRRRRR